MDITEEIITDFRDKYFQFSSVTTYPDTILNIALCEGDAETGSSCRWGPYVNECHNFKQRGMFLYAAFWLTITYPKGAITSSVVSPGPKYSIAQKEVGDESIMYDSGVDQAMINGSTPDYAFLSSNVYGQQFLRLRKRAGMGALAV